MIELSCMIVYGVCEISFCCDHLHELSVLEVNREVFCVSSSFKLSTVNFPIWRDGDVLVLGGINLITTMCRVL